MNDSCKKTTNAPAFPTLLVSACIFLICGCWLSAQTVSGQDLSAKASIHLVPQQRAQIQMEGLPVKEQALLGKMPANSFFLGLSTPEKTAAPQTLTLQFAADAKITGISTSPDFRVVPGGSCAEGQSYLLAGTCQLRVQFTPKGAGHRLGKVTVSTSEGADVSLSLMGYSYFPVVSFTPSQITTVPATVSGGAGLISGAYNMAIDSGDELFIADTGHGQVRYMDSSGVLRTILTGATTPTGIALDLFGNVFFDNGAASGFMYEIYNYATFDIQASGTGTDTCTAAAPCTMVNEQLYYPGMMSVDGDNNLIFANENGGAAFSALQPESPSYFNLYSPFDFQEATLPDAFGADANDNLYSLWAVDTECEIQGQTLYDAENNNVRFTKVAGGRTCGYSGDGGLAGGAEIGSVVGQIVFDLAGNLYFSDTNNQRVRRIDASTGIIRTIAGNGTAGYTGDTGPATGATLRHPAGLAVDSQGQVYILSNSAATGTAQVVRKVGVTGDLAFPSTTVGVASASVPINVANTGNSALTIVHESITGADAADFTIDPNNTSCNLAAGNSLSAGQSCRIGVIFKPAAAGARTAAINLVDNSIYSVNHITLTGTAVAPAVVKVTAPVTAKPVASGTKVTLSAKVTSASSVPTGEVSFTVDGKFVASGTLSAGAASVQASSLAAGSHTLVAAYAGDKEHAGAKATETFTVSLGKAIK